MPAVGEIPAGGPKISVAYVLPNLVVGGTEKHVRDLVERIDRGKFAPCVVCTADGGPLEQDLHALGIPVFILGYRGFSKNPGVAFPLALGAIGAARCFRRILRERNVRIVHAYLPEANTFGMIASAFSRTPVRIVSKRALCRYKDGHPVYSFFESFANLAADAVMVNSRAVAEDVRRTERFLGNKIFLVYNGLDAVADPVGNRAPLPPDLGLPHDAIPITYVANIREDKAHLCLVEAARQVCDAYPSVRFLFVGRKDREAADVQRRIRELGLSDRVLLTGLRDDIPAILGASRLVAHPGEQEGFSNAILEAMAAGLPVVASRAGGNPEAVVDGETGLLFPHGDADALARAILSLLRDPARAGAMGEAGRRRVAEHFPIGKMVSEVESLYETLLAKKR